MKLESVGDVIAVRRLVRADASFGPVTVSVLVGRPQAFPDSTAFYCPYQIVGAGSEMVKYAAGVDAIQAMQLVMTMIGTDLYVLNQHYGGAIRWANEGDLGFPEAAQS